MHGMGGTIYRRRGKIHWAKHSRFQLYEIFRGALATTRATSVHYLPIAKISRENFRGKLENRESLTQRIFSRLRYVVILCPTGPNISLQSDISVMSYALV